MVGAGVDLGGGEGEGAERVAGTELVLFGIAGDIVGGAGGLEAREDEVEMLKAREREEVEKRMKEAMTALRTVGDWEREGAEGARCRRVGEKS
ncbi:hypothetical protein HK101_008990 [Irineochytrium annulatum]|nr:hypothetical protein HK101_008990 [Irineochytrium annulatum]